MEAGEHNRGMKEKCAKSEWISRSKRRKIFYKLIG